MISDRKDGEEATEQVKKVRANISSAGNVKEASDARAKTVRGIMARNRSRGEK